MLDLTPKAESEKTEKLDFTKMKTFVLQKTLSRECKGKIQTGGNDLQTTLLTKN